MHFSVLKGGLGVKMKKKYEYVILKDNSLISSLGIGSACPYFFSKYIGEQSCGACRYQENCKIKRLLLSE